MWLPLGVKLPVVVSLERMFVEGLHLEKVDLVVAAPDKGKVDALGDAGESLGDGLGVSGLGRAPPPLLTCSSRSWNFQ